MIYFDHEKLDVYRLTIEFIAWTEQLLSGLKGDARPVRLQLIRSAQSIAQNIAEGNGKRPGDDRRRFFDIARGSALESAASLDVLVAIGARSVEEVRNGKEMLMRVNQMLIKMSPPQREVSMMRREDEESSARTSTSASTRR